MDIDADSARVRFPPPFVYLGFLLIGLAADRVLPWTLGLPAVARIVLAVALLAGGGVLGMAATGRFRRAGAEIKPWKPVHAIVDHGIYAYSRNPMYVGMTLLYAGIAAAFASVGAFLLLPVVIAVIRTQVIAREEAYLEGKFGDSYRAYKARVRRWL